MDRSVLSLHHLGFMDPGPEWRAVFYPLAIETNYRILDQELEVRLPLEIKINARQMTSIAAHQQWNIFFDLTQMVW